jgi:hypothetical protein
MALKLSVAGYQFLVAGRLLRWCLWFQCCTVGPHMIPADNKAVD